MIMDKYSLIYTTVFVLDRLVDIEESLIVQGQVKSQTTHVWLYTGRQIVCLDQKLQDVVSDRVSKVLAISLKK